MEKIQLKRVTTNLDGKSYSAGEIFINTEKKEVYAAQSDSQYITLKQYNTCLYNNKDEAQNVVIDIKGGSSTDPTKGNLTVIKLLTDGTTKEDKIEFTMSGTVEKAKTADKLNSNAGADGGSGVMRPIYFSGGIPQPMNGTIGASNRPVFVKDGRVEVCSGSLYDLTINGQKPIPPNPSKYWAPTSNGSNSQILMSLGGSNVPIWTSDLTSLYVTNFGSQIITAQELDIYKVNTENLNNNNIKINATTFPKLKLLDGVYSICYYNSIWESDKLFSDIICVDSTNTRAYCVSNGVQKVLQVNKIPYRYVFRYNKSTTSWYWERINLSQNSTNTYESAEGDCYVISVKKIG